MQQFLMDNDWPRYLYSLSNQNTHRMHSFRDMKLDVLFFLKINKGLMTLDQKAQLAARDAWCCGPWTKLIKKKIPVVEP